MIGLIDRSKTMFDRSIYSRGVAKMSNTELSALEKIALAGCVKTGELDDLKDSLPDGFSDSVSFDVHVDGAIQKGTGTPTTTVLVTPLLSLVSLAVFCEILRICGIGEARLRRALTEIDPAKVQVNEKLSDVFKDVENIKVEKMEKISKTISARRGSVQTQVTAKKI